MDVTLEGDRLIFTAQTNIEAKDFREWYSALKSSGKVSTSFRTRQNVLTLEAEPPVEGQAPGAGLH